MKYLLLVYSVEKQLENIADRECMENGEQLKQDGYYIAAEALQPVHTATTVRVRHGKLSVTDGPFAETKELVAGYWLWEVKSMQEAIEWVKRCPNPMMEDSDIDIRPVYVPADFGEAFTPELQDTWNKLQNETEKLQKK